MWAAAERPDAVRSLVMVNAFARAQQVNPIVNALFWVMMHNPWRVRTWAAYYPRLYPTQKPDDFQDYMQQLTANMKQRGRMDAAAGLTFSSRQPSDERLDRVQVPVLVIMGGQDPDFPDPVAEGRILAGRTGGRLAVIEGAGHYPQTEMPDETAPVVLDFIEGSAPREEDGARELAAVAA